MPFNPYPDATALRREDYETVLFSEQLQANDKFAALVRKFVSDLRDIHFPVGSPCKHYDVDDMIRLLEWDWLDLAEPDPERLQDMAEDAE